MVIINPMADGRCFWSCLFLHQQDSAVRSDWRLQARNEQGFPEDAARKTHERKEVEVFGGQILEDGLQSSQCDQMLAMDFEF